VTIDAYPLTWPSGRVRTEHGRREKSAFDVTFARARDDLIREVELLTGTKHGRYGSDCIMSTNIALRRNGLPLANWRQPNDPGAAVYFTYRKKQMSFACDRWNKVEDNLRAIAKTIEALRGIARWGTGDMLEAAFTGFVALPAPSAVREWWKVLCVARDASREDVRSAHRRLASEHHPDRGGDAARMAEINAAYDKALEEQR
jgi:DnaJ domain